MITAALIALFKLPKKIFLAIKNGVFKIVETIKVLFVPDYNKKSKNTRNRK